MHARITIVGHSHFPVPECSDVKHKMVARRAVYGCAELDFLLLIPTHGKESQTHHLAPLAKQHLHHPFPFNIATPRQFQLTTHNR